MKVNSCISEWLSTWRNRLAGLLDLNKPSKDQKFLRYKMTLQFSRLKMALVIFVLVLGNASPVESFLGMSVATAIGAATSFISAGSSLAGTTLSGLAAAKYSITCVIQVENWTRYPLLYPTIRINKNGVVTVNPSAILPGKKEGFSVRKPKFWAEGVYGTVSWEVQGTERLFVLMWSVPYSFLRHSNWMGVGLTQPGITEVAPGMTWFNKMYYDQTGYRGELHFQRGEFYSKFDPVIYRDENFEVVGTMSNQHKAEIKVIFRPTWNNTKDFTPAISQLLEHALESSN